jgi:hypothetical protein
VATAPPAKRSRQAARPKATYDEAPDDAAGAAGESALWAPPPGQSGDGKTSLNAKFGY